MNTKHRSHQHDHHNDDHHHHDDGLIGRITSLFSLHNHSHDHRELAADQAFRENEEGIRTIWLALAILLFTAVAQMLIVYFSGSVSLFADTAHNIGDGLNSIPLLIAFYLARRIPTRRYTYGFGRAEDVAGILIVISIAISAVIVFYEAFQRLINPQPLSNLGRTGLKA